MTIPKITWVDTFQGLLKITCIPCLLPTSIPTMQSKHHRWSSYFNFIQQIRILVKKNYNIYFNIELHLVVRLFIIRKHQSYAVATAVYIVQYYFNLSANWKLLISLTCKTLKTLSSQARIGTNVSVFLKLSKIEFLDETPKSYRTWQVYNC